MKREFLIPVAAVMALSGPGLGHPPADISLEGVPPLSVLLAIPPLQVDVTAAAWLPRLKGTTTLEGGSLDLDADLSLRDADALPVGELMLLKDQRWHLRLDGLRCERRAAGPFPGTARFGALTLTEGDAFSTEVEVMSLGADFGGVLWSRPRTADVAQLRVLPTLGVRWVDVSQALEQVGSGREAPHATWLGAMVGGQLHFDWKPAARLPLAERIEIRGQAAMGPALGGDGGFIWELRTDIAAFPGPQLAVRLGFRLLELDVEDEGWSFDGGLQGLFVAVTLRF
jgi:hypothetical protein